MRRIVTLLLPLILVGGPIAAVEIDCFPCIEVPGAGNIQRPPSASLTAREIRQINNSPLGVGGASSVDIKRVLETLKRR